MPKRSIRLWPRFFSGVFSAERSLAPASAQVVRRAAVPGFGPPAAALVNGDAVAAAEALAIGKCVRGCLWRHRRHFFGGAGLTDAQGTARVWGEGQGSRRGAMTVFRGLEGRYGRH